MYQCNQFCGGRLDTENFRLAAKERLLPFRCLHRHEFRHLKQFGGNWIREESIVNWKRLV